MMKSMKIAPKDAYPQAVNPEPMQYPYGLQLHLDEETLKKLGIKDVPAVGQKLSLKAIVEVCNTNVNESKQGENRCIGLQITDMELSKGRAPVRAEKLYDSK